MNFKIDENLPAEAAEILPTIGFVADTVADEHGRAKDETVATASRSEGRILGPWTWTSRIFGRTRPASTPGLSSCGSNARIGPPCSRMFAGWRRR